MLRTFKHRGLKRLWERGDPSGINPDWLRRVELILDALEAASRPEDLDLPGLRFHALRGDRKGDYAVTVTRNWRITFRWDGPDAIDVELEDYHG